MPGQKTLIATLAAALLLLAAPLASAAHCRPPPDAECQPESDPIGQIVYRVCQPVADGLDAAGFVAYTACEMLHEA